MKKIIIFSTAYLPLIGGAEIAIKEITERLPDCEFDLVCARIRKELKTREKIGRVNVYRVGLGFSFDKFLLPFLGLPFVIKLQRKNNYSIIWSMMASQASILASFLKMKFPEIKLVLTLQEGDEEEYLKRYVLGINFLYKLFIRPWHLLVFKKADQIQAISNYLKIRAQNSGAKCPIEVIPNGVNTEKFSLQSDNNRKSEIKKELGIGENEKIVITTSRLVKKNGVECLIKAAASIDAKLLILGDGPDRKKLENLAAKLGIPNKIIFFGRFNNDDLPDYLGIADIFVRPSLSEGQGISFLEAMSAGVPVIGTPVGGIPDFLFDNEESRKKGVSTGIFCKIKDPESIAESINLLFNDETLREKIIENARKLMEKDYSWDKISKKIFSIF